jgi:hypothetical protein
VQHYGYDFLYGANSVNFSAHPKPIPEIFKNLIEKIILIIKNKIDRDVNFD